MDPSHADGRDDARTTLANWRNPAFLRVASTAVAGFVWAMKFPLLTELAIHRRSSPRVESAFDRDQRAAQEALRTEAGGLFEGSTVILPWFERRDMTSAAGQGGHAIATEVPEIGAALRSKLVLERLGARVLGGLRSDVRFPFAEPGLAVAWKSETAEADEATFAVGALALTPKRVCAYIDVSWKLVIQGAATEAFIRSELMAALAEEVQRVAVAGTGASNEPRGILSTSGIADVAGGANGVAPTLAHLCDLEFAVTGTNKADKGHTGWLVSPKARKKLRQTFSNGTGSAPLWGLDVADRLLGHPAGVTTSVPDNLVKGSSGAVCSALIFGEFSELFVGLWGPGVGFEVNPHHDPSSGTVRFFAASYVDTGVRNAAAFGAMKDALC